MTNIAFIPARGGSKSIPLKNIMNIGGKSLIYWVLKSSQEAKYVDKIVVATENSKIKEVVLSFNFSKIEVFDRNPNNTKDNSPTIDVINDFIENYQTNEDDNFILIQATSPLLKSIHIDEMYEKFIKEKVDSSLSCVRCKRFFWTEEGEAINYDYKKRPRRQEFKGYMMENGACYISTIGNIKKSGNFLSGKISVYEMPEYTSIEIDEVDDWLIVEKLLNKYNISQKY